MLGPTGVQRPQGHHQAGQPDQEDHRDAASNPWQPSPQLQRADANTAQARHDQQQQMPRTEIAFDRGEMEDRHREQDKEHLAETVDRSRRLSPQSPNSQQSQCPDSVAEQLGQFRAILHRRRHVTSSPDTAAWLLDRKRHRPTVFESPDGRVLGQLPGRRLFRGRSSRHPSQRRPRRGRSDGNQVRPEHQSRPQRKTRGPDGQPPQGLPTPPLEVNHNDRQRHRHGQDQHFGPGEQCKSGGDAGQDEWKSVAKRPKSRRSGCRGWVQGSGFRVQILAANALSEC